MPDGIIIDDKLMSYSGDDLAFKRYTDREVIVEFSSSCQIFGCRCCLGRSASVIELARTEILKDKNI
jgi:hypothetical protein